MSYAIRQYVLISYLDTCRLTIYICNQLRQMINHPAFIKRVKSIMEYYQLTASAFADKIDVQASSISHLLSGRNKPSLDFVLKVLDVFPEVELFWLMNGKGQFPKSCGAYTPHHMPVGNKNDHIERIIIFYKDGTFSDYNPS